LLQLLGGANAVQPELNLYLASQRFSGAIDV